MEKEKVCPFFLLENSRPLSPWGLLDSLSTCLGNDSLILQYSGLENSMDCIVHGAAKCQTWLSDFHTSVGGSQTLGSMTTV